SLATTSRSALLRLPLAEATEHSFGVKASPRIRCDVMLNARLLRVAELKVEEVERAGDVDHHRLQSGGQPSPDPDAIRRRVELVPIGILVEQQATVEWAAASRKPQDRSGRVVAPVFVRNDRHRYGHGWQLYVRTAIPVRLHSEQYLPVERPDAMLTGKIVQLR